MKKKLISLLICITMVFTMTIPTYAVTLAIPFGTTVYLALGDSIGAGCKNFDYTGNPEGNQYKLDKNFNDQFRKFNEFEGIKSGEYAGQLKKDFNVYAVDHAYVSRISKKIHADKLNSTNGTFNGLRSKDVCRILGIDPVTKDDYTNDLWYLMMNFAAEAEVDWEVAGGIFESMRGGDLSALKSIDADKIIKSSGFQSMWKDQVNVDRYKYAIANSDVITVELGENDLSAFMANMLTKTDMFAEIEEQIRGLSGATATFNNFKNHCTALVTKSDEFGNTLATLKEIGKDLDDMQKLGANIKGIINNIMSVLGELLVQNQYYFTNMMNYINENKKPGAIVVVGTMINPIDEKETTIRPIMDLFIDGMNTLIKTEALKYDYVIADLTGVDLNPDPTPIYEDETKAEKIGEISYQLHPDNDGQQMIADEFLKQIVFAPVTKLATETAMTVVKGTIAEAILTKIINDDKPSVSISKNWKSVFDKKKQAKADTEVTAVKEENTDAVKQEESAEVKEPVTTETTEGQKLTNEEVAEMISDAALRCTTEKTSNGIKVTAKVTDADLDAIKEDGYQVAYKFYRSTKKSSGYICVFTSKTGKFTNTSVKEGSKYYYKTVLVVTDPDGNEVTKSVLKDCKYGARTF